MVAYQTNQPTSSRVPAAAMTSRQNRDWSDIRGSGGLPRLPLAILRGGFSALRRPGSRAMSGAAPPSVMVEP